eukprot:14972-Heterococcus_DN1.PRE.2
MVSKGLFVVVADAAAADSAASTAAAAVLPESRALAGARDLKSWRQLLISHSRLFIKNLACVHYSQLHSPAKPLGVCCIMTGLRSFHGLLYACLLSILSLVTGIEISCGTTLVSGVYTLREGLRFNIPSGISPSPTLTFSRQGVAGSYKLQFTENTVAGETGGAILKSKGAITFYKTASFTGNTASYYGAAIHSVGVLTFVGPVVITGNTGAQAVLHLLHTLFVPCVQYGGGIYAQVTEDITTVVQFLGGGVMNGNTAYVLGENYASEGAQPVILCKAFTDTTFTALTFVPDASVNTARCPSLVVTPPTTPYTCRAGSSLDITINTGYGESTGFEYQRRLNAAYSQAKTGGSDEYSLPVPILITVQPAVSAMYNISIVYTLGPIPTVSVPTDLNCTTGEQFTITATAVLSDDSVPITTLAYTWTTGSTVNTETTATITMTCPTSAVTHHLEVTTVVTVPKPVLTLSGVLANGGKYAQGTALSLVATAVNSGNTDITPMLDYAWKLGDAVTAISNLGINTYTYKCSSLGTNKISVASLATSIGKAYPASDSTSVTFDVFVSKPDAVSISVKEIDTLESMVAVNTVTSDVTVSFVDDGFDKEYTVTVTWTNGATVASAQATTGTAKSYTFNYLYTAAGLYTISATVSDGYDTVLAQADGYVAVYDSNGGSVTGAGSINSPAGSYRAKPAAAFKTQIGFQARYQKGFAAPQGNAKLKIKDANFKFESTSLIQQMF